MSSRPSRRPPTRPGRRSRTSINAGPTSSPIWSPRSRATPSRRRTSFVQVTEARAKATSIHLDANDLTDPAKVKELQDAQTPLSGALGRLLAVSENYPDLKSNQNFLALQSQLEGTENRIAVARRDYIAAVQDFNTTLRTFPSVLWAQTVFRSIKPLVPFTADSEAQAAPKVKF